MPLTLTFLGERLAIARFAPSAPLPSWLPASGFTSVTRTADELSIVCAETSVPQDATAERGWRAFRVEGPLDFALTGILASVVAPLAEARIPVFAIATYDTDYVLVREARVAEAAIALRAAGFQVAGA